MYWKIPSIARICTDNTGDLLTVLNDASISPASTGDIFGIYSVNAQYVVGYVQVVLAYIQYFSNYILSYVVIPVFGREIIEMY